MSKRDQFQAKVAQRIELAGKKTRRLAEGATRETSAERLLLLEDCRVAIATAVSKLEDVTAAAGDRWDVARRELRDVWQRMELAVRRITASAAAAVPSPAGRAP